MMIYISSSTFDISRLQKVFKFSTLVHGNDDDDDGDEDDANDQCRHCPGVVGPAESILFVCSNLCSLVCLFTHLAQNSGFASVSASIKGGGPHTETSQGTRGKGLQ